MPFAQFQVGWSYETEIAANEVRRRTDVLQFKRGDFAGSGGSGPPFQLRTSQGAVEGGVCRPGSIFRVQAEWHNMPELFVRGLEARKAILTGGNTLIERVCASTFSRFSGTAGVGLRHLQDRAERVRAIPVLRQVGWCQGVIGRTTVRKLQV